MSLRDILSRPATTKTASVLKTAATRRQSKLDDDTVLTKLSAARKDAITRTRK